jgi:aspartyl-tRNA(Asn)/glutamyl-tRNA(Gln) amidotransferase subunit A
MTTSRALVEACYERIDDPRGEGPRTFIRRFDEAALATAAAWDAMREAHVPLPLLAGLPISIKDLTDVAGSVTTAGSRALSDAPPATSDAAYLARLRAAGAVILGTTNMTEFAFGGLGLNPHYGTPRNPYDRASGRIPGGSSSGAAVSITDAMAWGAIGTDTAGSVRMPAALCGIAGFKPTARRVPLAGTIPLAPSLDSIGRLAPTVGICALLDTVLANDYAEVATVPLRGLRLAVPTTLVLDDLEPAVARAFARAQTRLSAAGALIVEVAMPELAEVFALNVGGSLTVAEGYAWHRRLLETHRDRYDPVVATRFSGGAGVSAADYLDVLAARERLTRSAARVTSAFDALLMPTVPIVAPRIADLDAGDASAIARAGRLLIRNPVIANVFDRCALSLPCHEPGEAPVGLMLMGEAMADRRILSIGLSVEALVAPGN